MTTRIIDNSEIEITRNKFHGDRGVGLYLGPAGDADPRHIRYRNQRIYDEESDVIYLGEYQPDADYFLNDATLAVVKFPTDQIDFTLPEEYINTSFWVDIRTHENSLENDSLFRPQRVTVDEEGELLAVIYGTASVVRVIKLDGGGCRILFEYVASLLGVQPVEFVISKTSGVGTVANVVVAFRDGVFDYSADVIGLADGEDYEFALTAQNGDATDLLISGIAFTSDAAGPEALTITAQEMT